MGATEFGRHVVNERLHLPASGIGAAGSIGLFRCLEKPRAALVQDGQPRHSFEQRSYDLRHRLIEDPSALRTTEDQQVGRAGWRRIEAEKFGPNRDSGDFGIAKPAGGCGKTHGGGLDPLADEAIGEAGHGIGLEGHGGNLELQRGSGGGARGVSTDAQDGLGLKFAENSAAGEDRERQVGECAEAGEQGDVFELADLNKPEIEAGGRDEAAFEAARRSDEEDFGLVAMDEFARDGQGRNDVAAGAAAGNENAEIAQIEYLSMVRLRMVVPRTVGTKLL